MMSLLMLHVDILTVLLASNQPNNNGVTPLWIASQFGSIEIVKVLLAGKDININQHDNQNATPLFVACLSCCVVSAH